MVASIAMAFDKRIDLIDEKWADRGGNEYDWGSLSRGDPSDAHDDPPYAKPGMLGPGRSQITYDLWRTKK
jgi:hypothetical protein